MRYVTSKDANEVVKGFVALGWKVEHRKRHVIVTNPANHLDRLTVSTGGRCGGYEHVKHMRSRLRRAQELASIKSGRSA